jgi:ABC-type transporter Mla MlaB component
MLKISEGKRGKQNITLRLEGRVVGPWVDELQTICEPHLRNDSELALDLAEVSFVDESGIPLLASLRSRGAKLLNATPFVEEQLRSVPTG